MPAEANKPALSYSVTRIARRLMRKFDLTLEALGMRFAIQHARDIKRLFTFYPGERGELDYTKYGVFLFPNRTWTEPLFFQVGIGIDHASGVIKGFTITAQPTAISGIRLYKNCVLPPRLWLSPELVEKYGDEFDVCGFDRLVAIDNARDLQSNATTLMFLIMGVIILCIPPKRGDLKGKVERTIGSLETMFFEALKGYVPNLYRFTDARRRELQDRARADATLTVEEFEELLLLAVLAFNRQYHPDLKKPRMQVYREGLEFAPMILPVGRTQIDTIFAMTYTAPVTREGVQAETWHYSSPELHEFCRVGGPKVQVCVPVDDVRTAIVYHPELVEPLLVPMTTHRFSEPTPMELAMIVLGKTDDASYRVAPDGEGESSMDRYFERMAEVQKSPSRVKGAKAHTATTGAAQAARVPPVVPPKPRPVNDDELDSLFGGPDGNG